MLLRRPWKRPHTIMINLLNVLNLTVQSFLIHLYVCTFSIIFNGTGGVMVSKFASNVVDRGFEPKSGQINDCNLVFVASPLSLQH